MTTRTAPRAEAIEAGSETTLASAAYARLRRDIVTTELRPGSKLILRELCARYQMGLAPVREALNRLSSEALVVQSDQRGFTVAPISVEDLDELLRARCWLNEIGLRQSIEKGDSAWEEHVLLSYHRLSRIPRPTSPHPDPSWERAHDAFHASLVAACGSSWLIGFCRQLDLAAERYRNISRSSPTAARSRSVADEHRAILEATLERRADVAVERLVAHFNRTGDLVREQLLAQPVTEANGRKRTPAPAAPAGDS